MTKILKLSIYQFIAVILFSYLPQTHAQVIITEIMYNPSGNENATEYIEIYNRGDNSVNLRNWQMSDGEANDSLTVEGFAASMRIEPGEYALILDPDYEENGEEWYEELIPEDILRLKITGSTFGSRGLSNSSSEAVSLINQIGEVVSTRNYLPNAPQGVSEERIFFELGEENSNWGFSQPGGTPGYKNSITPPDFDLSVDSLLVSVDTLSPGNRLLLQAWLSNKGIFEFPADTLSFFIRNTNLVNPGLISTHAFSNIDSAYVWSVEDSLFDLPGGEFELSVTLKNGGENNINDSSSQIVYVPHYPAVVQISELMPDPPDSIDVEWIEFKNNTNISIDLYNWKIQDYSGRVGVITDTTASIDAYDYFVIAQNEDISLWSDLFPDIYSVTTGWAPLNNSGDTLKLIDPTGRVIDHIAYVDPLEGLSLFRSDYSLTPNSDQWTPTSPEQVATPGDSNVVITPPDTTDPFIPSDRVFIEVSPDPFSPNNDGYEDFTTFSFEFPTSEVAISMTIYDINGRKLGTILEDQAFIGTSSWQWNGHDGLDYDLNTGIYVWLMDIRSLTAGSQRWKKKGTVVLVN